MRSNAWQKEVEGYEVPLIELKTECGDLVLIDLAPVHGSASWTTEQWCVVQQSLKHIGQHLVEGVF